ncbi:hypothetical protein MPLB_1080034 [Mesorhizobium sp. ORS 3324]|nr:hypothetical protein MPLB_1080034 [Mesorhizobium sp. ORS 3324]
MGGAPPYIPVACGLDLLSTGPVHDGVTVAMVPLGKSIVNGHSRARLRQRHFSSDVFHPKELPCPTPHETLLPTT